MEVDNYEDMNTVRSSSGEMLGTIQKQGNRWLAVRYENDQPSKNRRFSRYSAAIRYVTIGS